MSIFAKTAIDEDIALTGLGAAIDAHQLAVGKQPGLHFGENDRAWFQALDARASKDKQLAALLAPVFTAMSNPNPATFQDDIRSFLTTARGQAYPWCQEVLDRRAAISGYSTDHNLNSVDLGLLRQIEDDAVVHPDTMTMVRDALKVLRNKALQPEAATAQMFDIYGEAVVQRLVRRTLKGLVTIEKVVSKTAAPDFKCVLSRNADPQVLSNDLTFYIEVKTLDLAGGIHGHLKVRDEALDREIDLEQQIRSGEKIAFAMGETAPWRRPNDKVYDAHSLRMLIERMIERAENVLSATQFKQGPTFACLNLVRTTTPNFRDAALVPTAYHSDVGVCVTGLLYAVAFGHLGWQVHQRPEFEGAKTFDGELQREGILVSSTLGLGAAGLLVLDYQREYRLDGLFDTDWTDVSGGWNDQHSRLVAHLLCTAFNTLDNERGLELSQHN